jgi:hypothetical protein
MVVPLLSCSLEASRCQWKDLSAGFASAEFNVTDASEPITYKTIDGRKHQREGQSRDRDDNIGDGIVPGFSATGYIGYGTGSEYSLQPRFLLGA